MSDPESPADALVALHFAFPAAIEEEMIDFCHAQAALFSGFTMLDADGYGEAASLRTTVETVLGRARRKLLVTVLPQQRVEAALAALRAALPSPEIVYWALPVARFGRLS
ncbi:MAG: DUF3240 family protein [Steroidobacteraceae bacterium]|jgi:hypothetical protein|nr:DUF3240 family protein [Steroidobacteraceae bacterium]